jgi:hypothetical protein
MTPARRVCGDTCGAVHTTSLPELLELGAPSVPALGLQANVTGPPSGSDARTRKVTCTVGANSSEPWKALVTTGPMFGRV